MLKKKKKVKNGEQLHDVSQLSQCMYRVVIENKCFSAQSRKCYESGKYTTKTQAQIKLILAFAHLQRDKDSVNTTPEKFENAALFLRLVLPSTLIRHENGAFRKRSSKRSVIILLANGTLGAMPNEFAKQKGL